MGLSDAHMASLKRLAVELERIRPLATAARGAFAEAVLAGRWDETWVLEQEWQALQRAIRALEVPLRASGLLHRASLLAAEAGTPA